MQATQLSVPDTFAVPELSVRELKASIPDHCFERSYLRSFGYLFADLAMIGVMIGLTRWCGDYWLAWPIYWIVQGCLFTAIWVLAHECGHRAFCASDQVNDAVGFVLHSALLVPYHAWRISHGKHHRHTNHLELDEVFVPKKATDARFLDSVNATMLGRSLIVIGMLLLGWFAYLLFNATGRQYHRWANHFIPSSPIFVPRQHAFVLASDLGVVACLAALALWAYYASFVSVVMIYGIPYLIANAWLVLITYLQHTDESIPHYDDQAWTWMRGALSTIDRDFGILNTVFHHINDTHVLHHLFPRIPHYHAKEATAHIAAILGDHYRRDDSLVFAKLWKCVSECGVVVETPQKGVYHWKKS